MTIEEFREGIIDASLEERAKYVILPPLVPGPADYRVQRIPWTRSMAPLHQSRELGPCRTWVEQQTRAAGDRYALTHWRECVDLVNRCRDASPLDSAEALLLVLAGSAE